MNKNVRHCALVTGASRGVGKEIALQLSINNKLHILVNYSNDDRVAQEALDFIISSGGSGELVKFKVNDSIEVKKTLKHWQKNNEQHFISVLVNNAGIKRDSFLFWMDDNKWSEVIDVNLNGTYYVTKSIITAMIKHKFGRIINITSLSGLTGIAGQTNYSASKAGIIGFTKSLAVEVAKLGITVNAVAPGLVDTEMISDSLIDQYKDKIPLGRISSPTDIARLVCFLASENSSYITGETIKINGGLYT